MNNTCSNIKCKLYYYLYKIKRERFFLPLIALIFLVFDEKILYNPAAFMTIIFICCIILFVNFPILVTWTNSKPLYYDDLYLDSKKLPSLSLSDDKKKSYKKLYKIVLTLYNSVMISIISNYWVIKTRGTSSLYEIFGITGGILQIFHVLNLFTGTVLLYCIKHMINNESKIMPLLNRMDSDDNVFLKYDELDQSLDDEIKSKPLSSDVEK